MSEMFSLELGKGYPDLSDGPNPFIYFSSQEIIYGSVLIKGTSYTVLLGPVFEVPVTAQLINLYNRETIIPPENKEAITEFLYSIPPTNRIRLAKHLSLLHLILNNKSADIQDILEISFSDNTLRESVNVEGFLENQENDTLRSTYYAETEFYGHIRSGKPDLLMKHMKSSPLNLSDKKLANSPLRQAKNTFISTATSAGMLGAIPGGVDIEKTYHLMNVYIQECEQLQSIEKIDSLRYQMLVDFCKKVGEASVPPDGLSADLYICMNYIRSHTNQPITIEDVASQIKRCSLLQKRAWLRSAAISAIPARHIFKVLLKNSMASRPCSTENKAGYSNLSI